MSVSCAGQTHFQVRYKALLVFTNALITFLIKEIPRRRGDGGEVEKMYDF